MNSNGQNFVWELPLCQWPGPSGKEQPWRSFRLSRDASLSLQPIMRPYNLTPEACLGIFDHESNRHQEWPWAVLAFRKEYPLTGHLAELRGAKRNLRLSGYTYLSRKLRRLPLPKTVTPVSLVMVRKKAILRRLAKQSALLQPAWAALQFHSEDHHWLFLSEEPDEDWVRKEAVVNETRYQTAMRAESDLPERNLASVKDEILKLNYAAALALMQTGRFPDARPYWRRVLDRDENDAVAWCALGWGLHEAGETERARDALERATALDPLFRKAWILLGSACQSLGRFEEARQAYRRVVALDPFNEIAWSMLGTISAEQNDIAGALEANLRLLELNPAVQPHWLRVGIDLFRLGRLEEALCAFNQAVILDPKDAFGWNNAGYCMAHMGRVEEALQSCRMSLSLDPRNSETRDSVGFALGLAGRRAEVFAALSKAIKLNPQNTEARKHWAQLCQAAGIKDGPCGQQPGCEGDASVPAEGPSGGAADARSDAGPAPAESQPQ